MGVDASQDVDEPDENGLILSCAPTTMSHFAPFSSRQRASVLAITLLGGAPLAWAGRPLDTDDAGTNGQAECQLEAWSAHGKGSHESHVGPACGVGGGLEFGAEYVWSHPRSSGPQGRAVGAKWAPEWLEWEGARFGLKWTGSQERDASDEAPAWHWQGGSWAGIASVPLNPFWTVHANFGQQHARGPAKTSTTYGLALVWTPRDEWVLFSEVLGDNHSPAGQSVGLRFWLIPDKLGLDLTHSHTNATKGSHSTGFGLGWYGISF
ncbi:MAG: hypothetical protein RI907_2100 [Pseudomonadota bacterium]|jgi:hypothetical protein